MSSLLKHPRCDPDVSNRSVPPGSYIYHTTKGFVTHAAISLGFSENLRVVCPRARRTHPNLHQTMQGHPLWTFVLHKDNTGLGVYVAPLGAAMDRECVVWGAALSTAEMRTLYDLAEQLGFHESDFDRYDLTSANCQHFAGFVATAVGNEDMLKFKASMSTKQTAANCGVVSVAAWTGGVVSGILFPPAVPVFLAGFVGAWAVGFKNQLTSKEQPTPQ